MGRFTPDVARCARLSRRTFLRATGLGTAALGLLACAPAAPVSPSAPPAAPTVVTKPTEAARPVAPAPAAAARPAESPAAKPQPAASPASWAVTANPGGPFMSEDSPEWKAILEAARKEGEVTVYGGTALPLLLDTMRGDLDARYGLKVNLTVTTGAETKEKVLTERDVNRRNASEINAGESSMFEMVQADVFEELRALPNGARIHPSLFDLMRAYQGRAWPTYAVVRGLLVNSQLVPEVEEPQVWKDLLDPKWQKQIAMDSPTRNGPSSNVFDVTVRTPGYGEEYHRQLVKQEPLILRSPSEVEAAVARGERAIGFAGGIAAPTRQPGSPLKWIPMKDGLVISVVYDALVKSAPTPNAAKVYLNWLLSPELQAVVARSNLDSPSTMGIHHPLGYAIDNLKLLGPGTADARLAPEMQEKARAIYGR